MRRRATLAAAVVCAAAWSSPLPAHEEPENPERLSEVVVEARKPTTAASASDMRARDFELRPHTTLQDILNNVPGVVVRQHQGGGKATQYLVRGFNADHGTDFAVSVDGLPVNLVSHGHGQGYADMNFVIPETIAHLHLWKGPYFAHLGNLATAGALDLTTRDEFPEPFVLAEGGSFDRQRYVFGVSPKLAGVQTLLSGQAYYSNGPFENAEHFARYNVFGKATLTPWADAKLSLSAGLYAADWDASGQIPQRAVSGTERTPVQAAELLDRFDALDPTEGGRTDRQNVNVQYTHTLGARDEVKAQLWASRYKLRLWSNFTFFQDSTFAVPDDLNGNGTLGDDFVVDRRGDGIEQNDARWLYGANASWAHTWQIGPVPLISTLGLQTRHDHIDVALHRQTRRQRFFTVSDNRIEERTVSGYWSHQIFFTDWLRFEGGLRGDFFSFDVRNRRPRGQRRPRVNGYVNPNVAAVPISGEETDGIVSPKANVILTPHPSTEVYLNFGTGFHSNDARGVVQAQARNDRQFLPLARALGYEFGTRTRQFDDRLDLAASLWLIDLDSEIVFCGDCGTIEENPAGNFEPTGGTRRWGIDVEARYRLTDWLTADYDLSFADPRFKRSGNAIPIAPTLFMNGGLTMDLPNGFSAALRVRYLDDRPATEDRTVTARGYLVMDLLAKYRWRNVELSLALLNLGDFDWQEAVFADTSCTRREAGAAVRGGRACVGPGTRPDIHFTPGDPFGVRAGVKVFF